MIQRVLERRLLEELEESRAVALLGPRQAGKTTLALQVGESRQSIYLESPADRARLEDPEAFLAAHQSVSVSTVDCEVPLTLVFVGSMPDRKFITLECVLFDTKDDADAIRAALTRIEEVWMVAVSPGDEVLRARLPLGAVFYGRSVLLSLGFTGPSNSRDWSARLDANVVCPRDKDEADRMHGEMLRNPLDEGAMRALLERMVNDAQSTG